MRDGLPLRACSRSVEQLYLLLVRQRLPDVLAHGQRVNLVCEVVPALRPLENAANDVQLTIDRCIRPSGCVALADVSGNLHRCDAIYRNVPQALVDRLHAFALGLYATWRKMGNTVRQEALGSRREGEAGEVVSSGSEFACLRVPNEVSFFALSFAPVACVQRLPEPLPINKEMRVPSATALCECRSSSFPSAAFCVEIVQPDGYRHVREYSSPDLIAFEKIRHCSADKCASRDPQWGP